MDIELESRTKRSATVNVHVGATRYRFVYVTDAKAGTYKPEVWVYMNGPNGSPAGIGPKQFNGALAWLFGRKDHNGNRVTRAMMLTVGVPHLPWYRAYKLRRFGAMRVYKIVYKLAHLPVAPR